MKYSALFLLCLTSTMMAQNKNDLRTIEVTGETKKSIDPDEIIFTISIEEYWEEEFEGKKYKDFKTKVDIDVIEQSLMVELKNHDIEMSQITLKQAGNYWRQRGKDFLVNKSLELKLENFAKANELANDLETRGIRSMHVSRLKHKDQDEIKLRVKADAVVAARKKAELLAASVGKKIVDVLSIVEVDRNLGFIKRNVSYARAEALSTDAAASNVEYQNFKKIDIRAEVRVVFEMK